MVRYHGWFDQGIGQKLPERLTPPFQLQLMTPMTLSSKTKSMADLARQLKRWSKELGFQQLGIADTELTTAEQRLNRWLANDMHGEMEYMARHGSKRSRPGELIPGTLRVISVRMDYLPQASEPWNVIGNPELGYVARYALGRDYHKLMRKRLQKLADRLQAAAIQCNYRVFVDSAPVLEKPLAQQAGLGWQGKHTNLVNRTSGGWFFLGEIYTSLALPVDTPESDHCGSCQACIDICPSHAIIAPYQLDARRCISYLTIEHKGPIPLELRPLIGNRIYGCDDCVLVCPWNRFARVSVESDFAPRHELDAPSLIALLEWSEQEFLERMQGSPIRRIGHARWQRNIAVALGNASPGPEAIAALKRVKENCDALVAEHVDWALMRLQA
jgi:epoxyqueuosine reductase